MKQRTLKDFQALGNHFGVSTSAYYDGTVIEYDGKGGVILDEESKAMLSFEKENLIDSNIGINHKVLYTTKTTRAIFIHKEQNEKAIMGLGKKLKDRCEFLQAKEVFGHLLKHRPNHGEAEEQCHICEKLWLNNQLKDAKTESLNKKFSEALEKLKRIIDFYPNHEETLIEILKNYSQILGVCYNEAEKSAQKIAAKDFISKHKQDYLGSKNLLNIAEHVSFEVRDFDDHEIFAEILLKDYETQLGTNKICQILHNRAIIAHRKGDYELGLSFLYKIRTENPLFPNLSKLIDNFKNPSNKLIEFLSEENTSVAYSDYVHHLLQESSNGYSIEDARKQLDVLDLNEATTQEDKAALLLKKIGLQHILNEDFSSNLSSYFNIKSKLYFKEKKFDNCRFLCREGIKFFSDKEECTVLSMASMFIETYSDADYTTIEKHPKKYEDIRFKFMNLLSQFMECGENPLDKLILLTKCNNSTITKCIYDFLNELKSNSKLFDYIGFDENFAESEKSSFSQIKELWNTRVLQEEDLFNTIKMNYMSLIQEENLSKATINNLITCKKDYSHPWLTNNDKTLIREIGDKLYDLLNGYLIECKFVAKKCRKDLAALYFNRWNNLGENNLSDFFISVIHPFLQNTLCLLEKDFENFKKDSHPCLLLHSLNKNIMFIDNTIEIQLAIENTNDRAPFPTNIDISVNSPKPLIFSICKVEDLSNVNSQKSNFSIKKIVLKLDNPPQGNIDLQFCCIDPLTDNIFVQETFSFECHHEKEFKPINNKFTEYASGVQIKEDSDMFYGREKDIDDFVNAIQLYSNKHFLIYGQNRCGKSSIVVQIVKRLQEFDSDIICISFVVNDAEDELKKYGEVVIYHKILRALSRYTRKHSNKFKDIFNIPDLPTFANECHSDESKEVFTDYIISFKALLIKQENHKHIHIFIALDEFSCLYSLTLAGIFPKNFMKQWKALNENPDTEFSAILVGQNVMELFMEEPYASNAFQSIEARKLTYLSDNDARDLIEKPIISATGKSRYLGKSVDLILDYTSKNPFYIQIFCNELVKYENNRKSPYITEADVFSVADELIKKGVLKKNDFANLLSAGQPDPPLFPQEDTMDILTQIAIVCKDLEYCPINAINNPPDGCDKEIIIKHLCRCDVLEQRGNEFKIVIRLYQDWLYQNRM